MCKIQQCFCCCDLRVGTFLSAGYTMALGLLSIIGLGIAVAAIVDAKAQYPNANWDAPSIILIIMLVVYICWVITSIFLIVGAVKRQRGMMIPWMVMTIILTVLAAITIIISLASINTTFNSGGRAFSFILQIVILVFNIYALICVFSFYKDDCQEVPPSSGVKGTV